MAMSVESGQSTLPPVNELWLFNFMKNINFELAKYANRSGFYITRTVELLMYKMLYIVYLCTC